MSLETIINYALGIAGILIGVVVSFYTYFKSKESKEPCIYFQTFRDIDKIEGGEDEENIKVFYKSEEVDKVYTTYIWFWNKGKRPIHKGDIPAKSELKLSLVNEKNDLQILDYKIIKSSRDPINPSLQRIDNSRLKLDFEFLDFMDGWVMEVQHTGGQDVQVKFDGVILGNVDGAKVLPTVFIEEEKNPKRVKGRNKKLFFTLYYLILIIICSVSIWSYYRFYNLFFSNDNDTSSFILSPNYIKPEELSQITIVPLSGDTIFNYSREIVIQIVIKPRTPTFLFQLLLFLAFVLFPLVAPIFISKKLFLPVPRSLYFDLKKPKKVE